MTHITSGVLIHQEKVISKSKAFTIAAQVAKAMLGFTLLVLGLNGSFQFILMSSPTTAFKIMWP